MNGAGKLNGIVPICIVCLFGTIEIAPAIHGKSARIEPILQPLRT